jgi:hypothetical protein
MNVAEVKAYQTKVDAQLHEAKALLEGLEAHAKGKRAQAEIDKIALLKAKREEIEKRVHHDLKTAGEIALAAKVKSDIDAEIARFNTSLSELSAKAQS